MKVKVGKTYRFSPVPLDKLHPSVPGLLADGDLVVVVNQFGCPPANTMGHCYVEKLQTGEFAGLVCTNSLTKKES